MAARRRRADRVALGSGPPRLPERAGAIEPTVPDEEVVEATVLVRPRASSSEIRAALAELEKQWPRERRRLSRTQFTRRYGASSADMRTVESYAREHAIETHRRDRETRLLVLSGTVGAFRSAFGVEFGHCAVAGNRYRVHTGPVFLPRRVAKVVDGVFGLDELPRVFPSKRHFQTQALAAGGGGTTAAARGVSPEWAARTYEFPTAARGKGQRIGIVLLGGGYYPEDMEAYFGRSMPKIREVHVLGQKNRPMGKAQFRRYVEDFPSLLQEPEPVQHLFWWTIEAALDIQIAGSLAPEAEIVVYFAPDTERGKVEALATALTSGEDAPSVVNCSWGMRETDAHDSLVQAVDRLFQLAALRGVTVCCSSGDKGDDDRHVQYPASSPHVLACGGTSVVASLDEEIVWNEHRGPTVLASGGGFSRVFPRPRFQRRRLESHRGEHRGLPDVAGKANITGGYAIRVAGRSIAMGGTSAAAPMWASLIARLNESIEGRVGWLTPLLYQRALNEGHRPIVEGDNGAYHASPGWNPCCGLGTPKGTAILQAITSASASAPSKRRGVSRRPRPSTTP